MNTDDSRDCISDDESPTVSDLFRRIDLRLQFFVDNVRIGKGERIHVCQVKYW